MRIILSPAKKMHTDTDSLPVCALPQFIDRAECLRDVLQSMSYADLKKLWKCNDQIAALNVERLRNMDLRRCLTPALFAYDGIAFQYMRPGVFTNDQFDYIEEHLRILSGFYGVLRPFDGVTPYRLEMGAKLSVGGCRDLYDYWGNALAESICAETDLVINLASKEYSQAVEKHRPTGVHFVTVVFGEHVGGKTVEKGTLCKMARGKMVRWMAEQAVEAPEQLRDFAELGYRFCPEESTENTYTLLSFASHALFAAQNSLEDAAETYLRKALLLDLHDVMGNAGKERLHLACMGEARQAAGSRKNISTVC